MERSKVDTLIKQRLESAGILQHVDRDRSQLLDFPEQYFVEIVLNEGSHLESASRIIGELRAELEKEGVQLDTIIRALWKVKDDVQKFPPAVYPETEGTYILAVPFIATLQSGSRVQRVWVDMTPGAYEKLKHAGREDDESLCGTVADFLRLQLSIGGASYWDPIRNPRQKLDDAAVLYLLSHSPVTAA